MIDRMIKSIPDLQRDFILKTNACTVDFGAVLKHAFPSTRIEYQVGLFSQDLTVTERQYSVYELEMYAVVCATEHF